MVAQEMTSQNRFEVLEKARLVDRTPETKDVAGSASTAVSRPKRNAITSSKVVIDQAAVSAHSYCNLQTFLKELQQTGLNNNKLKCPPIIYQLKQDLGMVRAAVEAKGVQDILIANPNETPVIKMVLKGLPKSAVPGEIKEDLKNQKLDVISVAVDFARVRLEDYVSPQGV